MRWDRTITVIGTHAGGDIANVVTGGVFDVPGDTMFDKRRYLQNKADWLRKFLTLEPRGSVVTCADLLLPSNNPKADLGYIVMEPTEYPPLAGSSTIAVATVILETGILTMKEPVTEFVLEAPAGLVEVRCACRNGKVTEVKFRNVPAFALFLDAMLEVPGVGTVRADIAYGGMTYALVRGEGPWFRNRPRRGPRYLRPRREDQKSRYRATRMRASREPRDSRRDGDRIHRPRSSSRKAAALSQHGGVCARPARSLTLRLGHLRATCGHARQGGDRGR